jgi:hypothetical protein
MPIKIDHEKKEIEWENIPTDLDSVWDAIVNDKNKKFSADNLVRVFNAIVVFSRWLRDQGFWYDKITTQTIVFGLKNLA